MHGVCKELSEGCTLTDFSLSGDIIYYQMTDVEKKEFSFVRSRRENNGFKTVRSGDNKIFDWTAACRCADFPASGKLCILAGVAADLHSLYSDVHCRPGNDEEKP